jgi:hypothetical protein
MSYLFKISNMEYFIKRGWSDLNHRRFTPMLIKATSALKWNLQGTCAGIHLLRHRSGGLLQNRTHQLVNPGLIPRRRHTERMINKFD